MNDSFVNTMIISINNNYWRELELVFSLPFRLFNLCFELRLLLMNRETRFARAGSRINPRHTPFIPDVAQGTNAC